MPYKDPEKAKANAKLRTARYREKRAADPIWAENQRLAALERYKKKYYGDPEYRAKRNRVRVLERYKITIEDYAKKLEEQSHACAICRTAHIEEQGKRLFIDHDHSIGGTAVRGLLCNHCNRGIGAFKDRIDFLKSAILYLEQTL